jgi:hypothetical protein
MSLRNSAAPPRTKKQNCLKFSSGVILLGLGGRRGLGGMLRGDFSGDASVLGSVDRVTRVLLLGVTLVLTLGIGVIHLARCQVLRSLNISIFLFGTRLIELNTKSYNKK